MNEQKRRVAIFGNIYQTKKSDSIRRVLDSLQAFGTEVSMEREFHDFAVKKHDLQYQPDHFIDSDDFEADFAISLGGDGTLLKTAAWVGSKQIPIMGVNMGRLGFLADVSPDNIDQAIRALHKGDYTIERHTAIQVEASGKGTFANPYALNDIAVLKRDNASMISIDTSIDGEHLVTYQADGLIVSTPTGSTAYSLSNGGPIIMPGADIFCLTPVAPHSLNIRPIAIPADSKVELAVSSRTHHYLVAIDGRSEQCHEQTRLTIQRASHPILIVKQRGRSYIDTLSQKMMWGKDVREE